MIRISIQKLRSRETAKPKLELILFFNFLTTAHRVVANSAHLLPLTSGVRSGVSCNSMSKRKVAYYYDGELLLRSHFFSQINIIINARGF